MVSAWDVYWVMQLDSIAMGARVLAVAAGISFAGSIFFGAILGDTWAEPGSHRYEEAKAARKACFRLARLIAAPALLVVAGSFLIPSTKTAAAMVVLPAIANNQALQHEAGELYDLAKRGLHKAVTGSDAQASDPAK